MIAFESDEEDHEVMTEDNDALDVDVKFVGEGVVADDSELVAEMVALSDSQERY